MVERHLAKVNVASSNLVFRSKDKRRLASFIIWRHSQVVRQRPAKPLSPVQVWVAPPKIDILRKRNVDFTYYLFTLHYSLKSLVDFWKVISNSEKGRGMVQTRKSEFD